MRDLIRPLPGSKIREVANASRGRDDVLAFWFGEGDAPTPDFISDAAVASLARGETFYTHNLGLPELREAVAGYVAARHRPLAAGRIAITSSGVNALMIAMQALAGAGDEVVVINSPNNPTGWTLAHAAQTAILAHCRATGTWIVADEVYERLHFGAEG